MYVMYVFMNISDILMCVYISACIYEFSSISSSSSSSRRCLLQVLPQTLTGELDGKLV